VMRLQDYPTRSGVGISFIEKLSVDACCCKQHFTRRRIAFCGLFRIVKCPRCHKRALVLNAITDRDWSRHGGDLAKLRDEHEATGVEP
jgi:hypothetical protein